MAGGGENHDSQHKAEEPKGSPSLTSPSAPFRSSSPSSSSSASSSALAALHSASLVWSVLSSIFLCVFNSLTSPQAYKTPPPMQFCLFLPFVGTLSRVFWLWSLDRLFIFAPSHSLSCVYVFLPFSALLRSCLLVISLSRVFLPLPLFSPLFTLVHLVLVISFSALFLASDLFIARLFPFLVVSIMISSAIHQTVLEVFHDLLALLDYWCLFSVLFIVSSVSFLCFCLWLCSSLSFLMCYVQLFAFFVFFFLSCCNSCHVVPSKKCVFIFLRFHRCVRKGRKREE